MDQNRDLVKTLCNLEIPGDFQISPRGEKVLYSTSLTWGHLKGKHAVTTLWLATMGEANSSKQITDGTYRDHSLAWHPFKGEFAFVSDRAGHAVKSAIYTKPLTGDGETVPITPTENEQAIEKFKFSPDGKMIAFISKDEKTEEEKQREARQEDIEVWGQGYRYSRLRVIDLGTSEIRTLKLDRHVSDFCWIVEGSEELKIGFVSCENTLFEHPFRFGTDIHIVDTDLKQPKTICTFPNRPNDLCWGSTNLGASEELYFWAAAPPRNNFSGTALYKISIKEESWEWEEVASKDDQDIISVRSVNNHIIAKVHRRFGDGLVQVGTKKLYSCNQEIEAYDIGFGVDDGQVRLVVATSDVNHPVEVYSMERDNDKKIQLSEHGKQFQGRKFGTYTVLSSRTADHHKIEIDGVYLEPTLEHGGHSETSPSRPYPTIVLIHGGPSSRVTNAFNTLYYMWTPYLLSLGYGVLLPNYRGSSGRGREFASFSYNGAGTHAYADIIALTQHAIQKGYADSERLVVAGYSHGGLLSNLCALRNGSHGHGWTFKAAISGACVSDIDSMALTSDTAIAYQAELHGGAAPWTMSPEDTSTRRTSALYAFKEVMEDSSRRGGVSTIPPMLILHGANDQRCPVSQAWGMQRALEHYSLPFEMVVYPRQGHIFHEQFFWIDLALRVAGWVDKYIGPGRASSAKTLPVRGV